MIESSAKTVIIVEDEWVVAQTIQEALKSAGFQIAKVVASGADAVESADELRPDVIVMDIQLRGDLDGIAAAEQIGARCPTPVVYLTAHSDAETVARASGTEVSGFVLKPFHPRQLVAAVSIAAARGRIGARSRQIEDGLRSIASILAALGAPSSRTRPWHQRAPVAALTRRERQVVELLGEGARVATIVRTLDVAPNTVRNHLKAIFRKLGVHSQAELVTWLKSVDRPPR